ncbi:hypothetical protein [Desemzia sp. FAM 23989]|uniref:hypothetical protein n=1 Tax=Desemzia sp. FAM 23989 TaxID=3259523 RepID=UPI0038896401
MKSNFYNNPIKLVWLASANLLPNYLFVLWILIIVFLFLGTVIFDFISFDTFSIASYFSASLTGLTFTLALFTAEKNVFKEKELKILANYQGKNDKYKGQALIELLGPFVFTALLFLITGTLSLIVPFIKLELSSDTTILLIQGYIDILLLGLFSLFNLVMIMLNDVYHSVNRDT